MDEHDAERFNKVHAPAGSATGGQFAAASGSGSGGKSAAKAPAGKAATPAHTMSPAHAAEKAKLLAQAHKDAAEAAALEHQLAGLEKQAATASAAAKKSTAAAKASLKAGHVVHHRNHAAHHAAHAAHHASLKQKITTLKGRIHTLRVQAASLEKQANAIRAGGNPGMAEISRESDLKYGHGSALWDYWTRGDGFAKWSGAVHKWTTLHALLLKAGVPSASADGLTTNIIQAVMPGYMKQAHAKAGRSAVTEPDGSWDADGLDGSWDGDHSDLPDLSGLTVADLEAADDAAPQDAASRAMPKLGTGARFARLKSSLAAKGAKDPGALAAYIGRRKFGKGKFTKLAAKARGKGGASRMAPLEYFRTYELEDIHVVRAAAGRQHGPARRGVRRGVQLPGGDPRPRGPLRGGDRPGRVQQGRRRHRPVPGRVREGQGDLQSRPDDPRHPSRAGQHADRAGDGDPRRGTRPADPDPVLRDPVRRRGTREHPQRRDHRPVLYGPDRPVRPGAAPRGEALPAGRAADHGSGVPSWA